MPLGSLYPYVSWIEDLLRTNAQDICGMTGGFHQRRMYGKVFGSQADRPTLMDGIYDMPVLNTDQFFGRLEQCGSVTVVLDEMSVDADQVPDIVVNMIDGLRQICKVWHDNPLEAYMKLMFRETREIMGVFYTMTGMMFVWVHEEHDEVVGGSGS